MTLSACVVLVSTMLLADTPKDESTRHSEILDRLSRQMTSWKTLDVAVTQRFLLNRDQVNPANAGSLYEQIDYHRILADDAKKKMLDIRYRTVGGTTKREQGFDDGSECARVVFGGATGDEPIAVGLTTEFFAEGDGMTRASTLPTPYQYLYFNGVPLYRVLQKAEEAGFAEVMGRSCGRFTLNGARMGPETFTDLEFYLDGLTGIPLKITGVTKGRKGREFGEYEWNADVLKTERNYAYVARSTLTSHHPRAKTGERVKSPTIQFTVTSIQYDKPLPVSTFRPVILPGMRVMDTIRHVEYMSVKGEKTGK